MNNCVVSCDSITINIQGLRSICKRSTFNYAQDNGQYAVELSWKGKDLIYLFKTEESRDKFYSDCAALMKG